LKKITYLKKTEHKPCPLQIHWLDREKGGADKFTQTENPPFISEGTFRKTLRQKHIPCYNSQNI